MSTPYPDTWRFDTATGSVPASWLEDTQPAPKRGDTADFDVVFVPDGRGDHITRYEQLIAYQDTAGNYELHDVGGPEVGYTETHRESAPGGSLLVGVRPANNDRTGRGIWGLIDNVDDGAEVPRKRAPITVSVAYLAPLAESDTDPGYQTRRALARDLEADQL